ncbi:hypothetical protein LEP1GSC021_0394 [Leptospira noguchii str. 1993005606]|nr:hypothetical protein LEP1GSC021_0394 [Leptospira noguchii str. 1993005606]
MNCISNHIQLLKTKSLKGNYKIFLHSILLFYFNIPNFECISSMLTEKHSVSMSLR